MVCGMPRYSQIFVDETAGRQPVGCTHHFVACRCVQTLTATALAFIATAACSQTSPAPEEVITAIWSVQQLDFTYRSERGFYACNALQARLAEMLTRLGAHESVRVEMQCTGSRLVNSVRARISVVAPVEATEENVQAATSFDARDRLAARLKGFALPTAAEIERFPAAWRRVTLTESRRRRFDDSECELLSDVQQQILPLLSVRSVAPLYCSPWATRITRALEVEALLRVSAPAKPAHR
jgi:hypothetical protein